ncbi:MAG TPA: hypothetical protein VKA53_11545 [Thermoanaerobaculia bacterium]|nr:hypothetical protein [Thermoanaerobaculia bacterium]
MRFEAREIKPYIEPDPAEELEVGTVYFQLNYLNPDCLLPDITPWVYLGRDLNEGEDGALYFQDAASYRDGVRISDPDRREEAIFQLVQSDNQNVMYEFEKALEQLMRCSIRRQKREHQASSQQTGGRRRWILVVRTTFEPNAICLVAN